LPIAALGPLEALKKSSNFSDEIHLLLTDLMMPEMDGLALAQHILAERPEIRVILMSACTNFSSRSGAQGYNPLALGHCKPKIANEPKKTKRPGRNLASCSFSLL
jgi:CheY-like chemotaxis protein